MLAAPSPLKTNSRSAKFEIIKSSSSSSLLLLLLLLPLSHGHVKGFLSKCAVLKVDLLQDHQVYCLEACTGALLSPENLQAGAVNGLMFCVFGSC